MVDNRNNLKYRVEQLEESYTMLDKKIDQILTNHLPHIELSLAKLETKITMYTGINIAVIILAVVVQYLFLK